MVKNESLIKTPWSIIATLTLPDNPKSQFYLVIMIGGNSYPVLFQRLCSPSQGLIKKKTTAKKA